MHKGGKIDLILYEGEFTKASRFEDGPGTNPEELIGAAHAGCPVSMALASVEIKLACRLA